MSVKESVAMRVTSYQCMVARVCGQSGQQHLPLHEMNLLAIRADPLGFRG